MSLCYQQCRNCSSHCCHSEPDCLAGIIMLLFQKDFDITCSYGRGLLFQLLLFSMLVSVCITSWLCWVLFSTPSHDDSLAATIVYDRDHCGITLIKELFQWPDRCRSDSQVFGLLHKLWLVHSEQV